MGDVIIVFSMIVLNVVSNLGSQFAGIYSNLGVLEEDMQCGGQYCVADL